MSFTNKFANSSFFAYDPLGKRVTFVEEGQALPRLLILEKGKVIFSRPLLPLNAGKLYFGNAQFARKGDVIVASYQVINERQTNSTFGLMEIPISDAPLRLTPLVSNVNIKDESALYFQISVSHDGKTAACSSSYLACECDSLRPEDCALFLIDLQDSKRKVTKALMPMPAKRNS